MLLAYAHRYAASVGWKTKDRALARGQGIEDLVQDAMLSLYDGDAKRSWDPATTPDSMEHLKSFVNSRLSTLARSYDNRNVKQGIDPDAHGAPENPESLVLKKAGQDEEDAWWVRAKDLLVTEILGDDLVARLHDLMEKEEIDKPAELSTRLGVSVQEIKNAKKRFRRAWEKVMAAMKFPKAEEVRHG
jgi:DNA-directed RNA polymerase specialized sigma24 family protein